MTAESYIGPAIVAGYQWSLRIEADTEIFPSGSAIVGQVRRKATDTTILATLSTTDGTIVRVNDSTIDLFIDGETSADWEPGTVVMDFVRTDENPDRYLGFVLTVPVVLPVTRGAL
jgi:hypothetical protein